MSSVPRLGFLGVGWIGRHRMRAIADSGAGVVAAICDTSRENAQEAAHVLKRRPVITSSLDALLELELDGIVIATPSAMHAAQSIAVLERGLPVFCQKPLARTSEEVRRVVDAARANDLLIDVDLSYRHTTAMRRVRELVTSGALGTIYAADLVFHNAYGPGQAWFFDPALSGGGCVVDLGIHLVDLALWTLDHPKVCSASGRLFARGRRVTAPLDVCEDFATARLDVETGATIDLACSWNLSAGRDAVIGATFYGTEGSAALRNVKGSFYDFVGEQYLGTSSTTLAAPPDEWGGRAAVAWARRLATDRSYDPEIERQVDVSAALDAIYGR